MDINNNNPPLYNTQSYSNEQVGTLLRQYWTNIHFWTRLYLISKSTGEDDLIYIENKLYEIALEIVKLYSLNKSDDLLSEHYPLLKNYITSSLRYIDNLLQGNELDIDNSLTQWKHSALLLSNFYNMISNQADSDKLYSLFINYINLITYSINNRLNHEYNNDIIQFELSQYLILAIADILSLMLTDIQSDIVL